MPERETIIVTGGTGMIGSNLVKRLVRKGHEVLVIDNLWRGKLENLLDEETGHPVIDLSTAFFNRDLTCNGKWQGLFSDADFVFHLADVVAGINYVFENEGSLFRRNMLINSNVMHALKAAPIRGFIYTGTACSYPAHLQKGLIPYALKEDDQLPADPESAYGWSKLMGEYEARLMEKEHGIPVSILNIHNVYGAPCDFGPARSQVIPSLIRKAIAYPLEPFRVWGNGLQSRAFVHVDDVVDALIAAKDNGLGHGIFQIGPQEATSIKELAETVVRISGKAIAIEYDDNGPVGDISRCADYSKAKAILGWEPEINLEDGLIRLYQWIERQIQDAREEQRISFPGYRN